MSDPHRPGQGHRSQTPMSDPAKPSVMPSMIVNWTGALLSVALVVGISVWGYRLSVRDVTNVPVVLALTDPMRIESDDPGGELAVHRGLSVNDLQAGDTASARVERVVLAPAPLDLDREDTVMALASDTTTIAATKSLEVAQVQQIENAELDLEALIAGEVIASLQDTSGSLSPETNALASLPGVARSPRPVPRPLFVRSSPTQTTGNDLQVAIVNEIAPEQVTTGTRLVQLGAFDERDQALNEWVKIAARHSDLLEGKQRLIQKAESGGRSFFRLRAVGFDSLSDSRRFCSVLLASKTPCIPVTAR
jgi:hypothetical protein